MTYMDMLEKYIFTFFEENYYIDTWLYGEKHIFQKDTDNILDRPKYWYLSDILMTKLQIFSKKIFGKVQILDFLSLKTKFNF